MKRQPLEGNREKVLLNVLASPLEEKHRTMLAKWVGPADKMRFAPVAGNLMAFEFVMEKGHLFGALRDCGPPVDILQSSVFPIGRMKDFLVGYIGTTGELGWLDILDKMIISGTNSAGYANNPAGLWRRNFEKYTVFSLHPELLASVIPQLRMVEAKRPAQLRLEIDDLARARMTPFLNAMGYKRTRETSLGNIRLMHALDQQLHVPPEACRDAAELLMDAKLICPLGGEYKYHKLTDNYGRWTSTAIQPSASSSPLGVQPPPGYQAPPLNWFRSLKLDAVTDTNTVSAHAEIIMQMPE